MNKAELIASVREKCGGIFSTKKGCADAVDAVLDTMLEAVASGEGISLVGFGSLSVERRDARMGRNPQTGEDMKIKAKNVVKFRPSKNMKELAEKAKIAKK